ncbi:MAG: aryl-sulfate sulfotransferase [Chitinophagales bacterium]|nr:aryl-sulfate sulfotransferase [Chitinophagales bacterium]
MKLKLSLTIAVGFTINILVAQQWGYATLIAPQNSTTVTLIDTNNNVIKTWTNLSGQTGYSCYLMPGGYLWRSVKTTNNNFTGGGLCGRVQKVDWNGNILFDYTISDANQITHHDICPMPNGNVMLIVYDKKTAAQMTAAGATSNTARQLEKIVELQPTGTNTAVIAWQWNLYDHLCQSANSSGANYVSSIVNNPQLMNVNYQVNNDWIHMNGIDYNAELDQVVVSSHNLNELWVIDHSTTTAQAATHTGGNSGKGGDFLYRWGNPAAYGAAGTKIYNVVHDAHWVPSDCPRAGWLAAFNNKGVSNTQSSVDIFQPTWNGSSYTYTLGQQFQPATYGYRHACVNASGNAGSSNNMGNSQQLPNGNMLICLALSGYIYEIDSNGNKIWDYTGASTYAQAFRYSRCFIQNPSISITNSAPSVCANSSTPLTLNTSVTATAVSNFTYQWAPATGLSSTTIANPSVSNLSTNTTYTVTVSTGECTATASVTVNVNALPNANAGNDVTITSGQSTILTATGGTSYAWSNGASTANTTVNPSSTTTYTVTVTNASGCTASDAVTVFVSGGSLSVTATISGSPVCAGTSVQLNAVPSGGSGTYTYQWASNPAGFSSNSQSNTVTPLVNTTYTVTVNDGSVTATASVSVSVNTLPNVSAGSDVTIPFGNSATLIATGASSYVWSNGATSASHSVSPSSTTIYTVTGTDGNGCSGTASVTVNVTGAPLSVNVSASETTICNGEATQLFANATGGSGTYTYSWASNPAGFSSTLHNPYINPTATTVYNVTVNDGSSSVTASFTITVLSLPAKPVISANDTILTSSSSANNQWFYYGNPIDGATNQTLMPTLEGSYQVQVTDANGCASPMSDPYEYTHVGIGNVEEAANVTIFPNPAKDRLMIAGNFTGSFKVALFDYTGRMVLEETDRYALLLQQVNSGVYVCMIETNTGKIFKRVIVSK